MTTKLTNPDTAREERSAINRAGYLTDCPVESPWAVVDRDTVVATCFNIHVAFEIAAALQAARGFCGRFDYTVEPMHGAERYASVAVAPWNDAEHGPVLCGLKGGPS